MVVSLALALFTGHHSTLSACQSVSVTSKGHPSLDGEHLSWDGYSEEAKLRNTSGHHSPSSVEGCYRGDGFIPPNCVQNTQMRQKMEKDKDNTGCGASQLTATLAKNTPSGLWDWLSTEDHPGGAEPSVIHLHGLERQTTARGSNKYSLNTGRTGRNGGRSQSYL